MVEHWSPKPGVGSSSLSTRARKNNMLGILKYFKESYGELKNHVSWQSFNEGLELTVLVGVFSIIFSLIIWALDSVFSRIIKEYFNLIN